MQSEKQSGTHLLRRFRALLLRLAAPLARGRRERDMASELEAHLQLHIDDNLRAGMTPDEARRHARLALGGVEQTKQLVRDARATIFDSIRQDVVFALRLMRRSPIVTAAALLSLALGIGANTAIFSIIDRLMLRTLPVREPQRLALLGSGTGPAFSLGWTNPLWEQIRDRREAFDGALAWSPRRFDLSRGGQTQFVDGIFASGRFFEVLGVPPMLGRTFRPDDDGLGGGPDGPVVVISHDFWQRRFDRAADVIGRTLTLDRVAFAIVGVTPPGFRGLTPGQAADVMVPIACEPMLRGPEAVLDTTDTWLTIMIRLKTGQTLEAGAGTLRGLQSQLREASLPQDPDLSDRWKRAYLKDPFVLVPAGTNGLPGVRQAFERPLLLLMAVVALVLLVACANVANLSLARAAARRHELGVRLALGASRWRLARLLLTESLVTSAAGAALGLIFAEWAAKLLLAQLSTPGRRLALDLSVDWRMLAFTAVTAVVTALLCGVAPAWSSARTPVGRALAAEGRGVAGFGRRRLAGGLVVVQVALSVVLVVGALLFLRSFAGLVRVPLGFDSGSILIATIDSHQSEAAPAARLASYESVREAVAATPGVADAAISRFTPLTGGSTGWPIEIVGRAGGGPELSYVHRVTRSWFSTYGTRVVAGRDLTELDRAGAAPVAIVNEAFVRRFLDGGNALGRAVRTLPPKSPPRTIVGVVADARYDSLRNPAPPTLYVPLAQADVSPVVDLSVRSAGPKPATLVRDVAAAVARVNPQFALTFRPLDGYIGDRRVRERMLAMLSGFFGGLALVLASIGLFGVTSYTVNRRRSEIGIRMALGASAPSVVRGVLQGVACLVGVGVVIGVGASLWAARFAASLLFGVKARDPVTLATAAAVLAAAALLAGWLPARRAARIDPAFVLRNE